MKDFIKLIPVAAALTLFFFLTTWVSGDVLSVTRILWHLLANFLIACVLGIYVAQCSYHSYKLLLATSAVFYIIGSFNIVIEGVIFNVVEASVMVQSVLFGIPNSVFGSFLVIWILGRWTKDNEVDLRFGYRKISGWIGKILLANFIYIFFYIAAGMLVDKLTPGFTEFYRDKLPSPAVFFMTNMGFRGFVFVTIAILIDRSITGELLHKGVLIGLVFSVIGGIAPLIPPSEFMPQFIRFAHGFEVGISNFLYGYTVWLIVRSNVNDQTTSDG